MKKTTFAVIAATAMLLAACTKTPTTNFSFESSDLFFEIADSLSQNQKVAEETWARLFDTKGYKTLCDDDEMNDVRRAAELVFAPNKKAELDSILNAPYDSDDDVDLKMKILVRNYVNLQSHFDDAKKFRTSYDFGKVKTAATKIVHDFLPSPVDSLLTFPNIEFFCYARDASNCGSCIIFDFNYFYLYPQGCIESMAHEMFHNYRYNFTNDDIIYSEPLLIVLDHLQDEGIADLINKKGSENTAKNLTELEYPELYEQKYLKALNNSSKLLAELESLTFQNLDGELSDDDYKKQVYNLFPFHGHPVAYKITQLFIKHGLRDKMMETFYNPVEFIKLYNSIAESEGMYVFSDRFVSHIEQLFTKPQPTE